MHKSTPSRPNTLTIVVSKPVTFTLADVRILALDPELFAACSEYAKGFFPRCDLARGS